MRFRRDKSDALHIIDGLESAVADGYIYGQWPSIAEHLSEHVQRASPLACSRGNILVTLIAGQAAASALHSPRDAGGNTLQLT